MATVRSTCHGHVAVGADGAAVVVVGMNASVWCHVVVSAMSAVVVVVVRAKTVTAGTDGVVPREWTCVVTKVTFGKRDIVVVSC